MRAHTLNNARMHTHTRTHACTLMHTYTHTHARTHTHLSYHERRLGLARARVWLQHTQTPARTQAHGLAVCRQQETQAAAAAPK